MRGMSTRLALLAVAGITAVAANACGGGSPPGDDPDARVDGDGPGPGSDARPGADADPSIAPTIPAPTGTCPAIVDGVVTFAPAGIPPRQVTLSIPAGTHAPGPLIIYWHATGSVPAEAAYSLGATLDTFTAAGGIVAAPAADPAAGTFEWFIVNGSSRPDDFLVADEIVACLAQAGAIDTRRIHSMGMSAGGLQTTATSFVRSDYIASVATYSGGVPPGFTPSIQDPTNKFAALIFDGGATDNVFGVDFQAASHTYRDMLSASGHYAAICEHGHGHEIPLDAAASVIEFFAANPYGAWPSPYAATGLPDSFPPYCQR